MKYPHCCLVLFARAPVEGQVKTRMIPALGARGACELHRRLLQRSLALLQQAPCAVELWVDAQGGHPAFAAFAGTPHLQQGADLGARMAHAAAEILQRHRQVVFIGSDCPALDLPYLEAALAALQADRELVLGPATDGGYVLLGMARSEPALFRDIDWGGPEVLQQTLARAAAVGMVPHLLPALPDIDRPEDLALLPDALVPQAADACGYNAGLSAMPQCRCAPATEVPDE